MFVLTVVIRVDEQREALVGLATVGEAEVHKALRIRQKVIRNVELVITEHRTVLVVAQNGVLLVVQHQLGRRNLVGILQREQEGVVVKLKVRYPIDETQKHIPFRSQPMSSFHDRVVYPPKIQTMLSLLWAFTSTMVSSLSSQ